ncbi:uncharacterized protein FIESC28_08477 [Fusarium coffeatum]|uniref:Uncharacterized protein n=1 Tax=Fusarium coffeatum TaxID=231269 RepID=A0A366R9C6_9HYPO|nr:uncharacterized protein FIESC28_08477 [Fusarium coffeatum]RBR12775.1 hypothetical protein FIESC28_08477 [Fusarium coffeatum]
MWASFFHRGSIVLSIVPGLFGLLAVTKPESMLKLIEFPIPTEPQNRKLACALARLHGIRNIILCSLFINNALTGDKNLIAANLAAIVFMMLGDGFVSRSLLGRGEWLHWGYIPFYGGFIAGLLYAE